MTLLSAIMPVRPPDLFDIAVEVLAIEICREHSDSGEHVLEPDNDIC